jgi:hypothetical protein
MFRQEIPLRIRRDSKGDLMFEALQTNPVTSEIADADADADAADALAPADRLHPTPQNQPQTSTSSFTPSEP